MIPLPSRVILLCLLSLVLVPPALAAAAPEAATGPSTTPAPPADGSEGGAPLGARLARDGNDRGAGPCAACHGAAGQGQPDGGIPRLAGLPRAYLEKQLQDFGSGARRSEVMSPVAKALLAQEQSALAAHFAAMAPPASAVPSASAKDAARNPTTSTPATARGERLLSVGDNRLQVQACANCHGPGARGVTETAVPWLAGQHPRYLASAMEAWRNGTRNNDPSQQMPTIARRLRPEDVEALLAWLASQVPPAPATTPTSDQAMPQ